MHASRASSQRLAISIPPCAPGVNGCAVGSRARSPAYRIAVGDPSLLIKEGEPVILSPRYCNAMTVIVPEVSVPLPSTRLLTSDLKTPALS